MRTTNASTHRTHPQFLKFYDLFRNGFVFNRPPRARQIEETKIFSWIEFPNAALQYVSLQHVIQNAMGHAKEIEIGDATLRLFDLTLSGHFTDLELKLSDHNVPYDCGWESHADHGRWQAWWRPGMQRSVIYEVSVTGDQLIEMEEIVEFRRMHASDPAVLRVLDLLIRHLDRRPTVPLGRESIEQLGDEKNFLKMLVEHANSNT